ncbi:hypothetical protein D3C84_1230160 [compost metagenome]
MNSAMKSGLGSRFTMARPPLSTRAPGDFFLMSAEVASKSSVYCPVVARQKLMSGSFQISQ